MSAALVPTFSPRPDHRGPRTRLAARQLGAERAAAGHRRAGGRRDRLRRPLVRLLAGDFAAVPGKFELTVQLTRIVLPFLTLVALAAACMGMLNSLERLLRPGAVAGDVQRRPRSSPPSRWCRCAGGSASTPIMAVAVGTLVGGLGQVLLQWPALRARGLPLPAGARPRATRAAPRAGADGAGHDRPGRHPGQRLRQHRGRHRRRHRRGVVARLRVPGDVPADRPLRRLDRHGHHAGDVAAGGHRATSRAMRSHPGLGGRR